MKFFALFAMLLLAASFVAAEETTVDPGTLPDSPVLWGLDRAWDRIAEITGGDERARVNALERIEELRALSQKYNGTEKESKHLNKSIEVVKNYIEDHDELNETVKQYAIKAENLGRQISAVARDDTLSKEQRMLRFQEIKEQHSRAVEDEVTEIRESRLNEVLDDEEREQAEKEREERRNQ